MDQEEAMSRLGEANARAARGDRAGARELLGSLWAQARGKGDAYIACLVAHFLAHAHDLPEQQLEWHQRALYAANAVGDERVSTFYPSLHANLSEVYLRLGDIARAEEHVALAREGVNLLPDDGYGGSVRMLIERVERALAGAGSSDDEVTA